MEEFSVSGAILDALASFGGELKLIIPAALVVAFAVWGVQRGKSAAKKISS